MSVVRRLEWRGSPAADAIVLVMREWLVTNGLGGYASGTVSGALTRRYHGLLVAALPAPLGRTVMLSDVSERLRLPDGTVAFLGGEERRAGGLVVHGARHLREFRLEAGLPVWRYEVHGAVLEKRVLLVHGQNTVHLVYRLLDGPGPVRLGLRPSVHFRPHHAPVSEPLACPYALTAVDDRYELSAHADLPPLRLHPFGEHAGFTVAGEVITDVLYRVEGSRGYDDRGELWSPGYFRLDLPVRGDAALVASTEPWATIQAMTPAAAARAEARRRDTLRARAAEAARDDVAAELVLAADQFIVAPAGRVEDVARAHAAGDEVRSVIAGYPWFTDWGRDTMIALEGLALVTGRHAEAGFILRTFAHHVRDGLIPNLFPEGDVAGLYHTADATLWFFHALDRYLLATGDRRTLELLLPTLVEIAERHVAGTRFGIAVDPADGLLRQGEAGYQLTWMDAKVGDWVVTPRRGKAVEINALWYNALRLLERWVDVEQGAAAAKPWRDHAERARRSFNERFWYAAGGYLYDVVDGEQGDDPACRPNQLFALSLPHAVLDGARWSAVLDVVRERLLTPVGLRTLGCGDPAYKAKYDGDLRARDAAYHQGTVWPWLIGPFVDAWMRVHPDDRAGARAFLAGLVGHLGDACLGSVSEIFDAESPFTPRGCIAQAWSVAELLRSWVRTAP